MPIQAPTTPPAPPSMSELTFTQHLRQATRAEHQRIERAPLMARLFAADYTLGEYHTLLARLHGFYNALEPALFSNLPAALNAQLSHRRKSHLLASDLNHMGLSAAAVAGQPRCFDLPQCHTLDQRLGVFYVLEGSTMGGQIIRRRLLARFGDSIAGAVNFYACYGEAAGREWRALRELLDHRFASASGAACRQAATDSARATFASLTRWLEQPPNSWNTTVERQR